MKTKVLAALVATMAVGATCAFAANPFVDVPTDSWAYKSVVELADAGIIQGVDGSYFQGDRNITRYEAAEMTAKAMAHMDKASVEQRALINKLADEYADELNSLGVRVSNLENKVGNVKLTGDARIRYRYQDDNAKRENDNSWDYRIRLRANAQVNDRTKVTYGVSTNNHSFGNNGAANGADDKDSNDTYTDLANVDYNFGGNNWDLMVGRYTYVLGDKVGYQFGDSFDGAQLQYKNDKFKAIAGYGKFKVGARDYKADSFDTKHDLASNADAILNGEGGLLGVKTGYGELEGFFGGGSFAGSSVGVYYNDFFGQKNFSADDLWGAFASFNFGHKWNLTANYEKISSESGSVYDDPDMWYGKLQYGTASFAAPKSWDAWVEYLNAEKGAFLNGSTNMWRWADMDNVKSWGVGIDYTFAKNAMFSVMQSFASETKSGSAQDPEEMTRANFVFVF
ncbi:S-layer homology domain-containing protein [uncultured Megasphaera sp.]|uniref:S-layer homology domain-containing protein n=1 Tax=uncultured Megasphaera sp. TaxID=165188 RepID=UPI0025DEEA13|nr:S-layer homology domain-containing protein [uncultured Megasphaera sp.]